MKNLGIAFLLLLIGCAAAMAESFADRYVPSVELSGMGVIGRGGLAPDPTHPEGRTILFMDEPLRILVTLSFGLFESEIQAARSAEARDVLLLPKDPWWQSIEWVLIDEASGIRVKLSDVIRLEKSEVPPGDLETTETNRLIEGELRKLTFEGDTLPPGEYRLHAVVHGKSAKSGLPLEDESVPQRIWVIRGDENREVSSTG